MAKLTIVDVDSIESADAWQAQESKPLYAELAKIEAAQAKYMAEVTTRKRELRDALLAIEQQAAKKRIELRPADAGPDQVIGG